MWSKPEPEKISRLPPGPETTISPASAASAGADILPIRDSGVGRDSAHARSNSPQSPRYEKSSS